jgi:hypothetical protein
MQRTQIQLTDEQLSKLRRAAAARGISVAALIREAVDRELLDEADLSTRWERALSVVGKHQGDPANVSEDHDEYLADAFAE